MIGRFRPSRPIRSRRRHRGLLRSCLAGALALWLATPVLAAGVMTNDDLLDARGRALIYIVADSKPNDLLGYGVLLTSSGYALTASHILNGLAPHAIAGILGRSDGRPRKMEVRASLPGESEKDALTLLKFVDPLIEGVRVPVANPRESYSLDDPVRIVTGSVKNTTPSQISAYPSSSAGALELAGPGVEFGTSGSPAYDRAGNLIGIVTEGVESAGRYMVRTTKTFRTWVTENSEPLLDETIPPDLIALYVTNKSNVDRSSLTDVFSRPLDNAFFALSEKWLRVQPEVIASGTEQYEDVSRIVYRTDLSPAEKAERIERYLNAKENFRSVGSLAGGFNRLYLVIVQLQQAGIDAASSVLLVIDQKLDHFTVAGPLNREFKGIPRDVSVDFAQQYAVELLHHIIRAHLEFGHNGRVMTDCFALLSADESKLLLATIGPQMIARRLVSRWENEDKLRGFRPLSPDPATCDRQRRSNQPTYEPDQQLSEYSLKATIYPSTGKFGFFWQLRHPWAASEDRYSSPMADDAGNGSLDSPEAFDAIAKALVEQITSKWLEAVDEIRRRENK